MTKLCVRCDRMMGEVYNHVTTPWGEEIEVVVTGCTNCKYCEVNHA